MRRGVALADVDIRSIPWVVAHAVNRQTVWQHGHNDLVSVLMIRAVAL